MMMTHSTYIHIRDAMESLYKFQLITTREWTAVVQVAFLDYKQIK